MTGFETATLATAKVVAEVAKVNALKNALEANEIGPALLAATGVESVEYGGLLNGMQDASGNLRQFLENSGMLEAFAHRPARASRTPRRKSRTVWKCSPMNSLSVRD